MTTAQLSAVLVAKGTVTVALPHPHHPDVFYKTGFGLYVTDNYWHRIVEKAKPTQPASPVRNRRFLLARHATNKDIEAELGAEHVFTESEVCWIVAEMIGKQEGGTAGDLDTGNPNLFYTPGWVVSVVWDGRARGRKWNVLTWGRDGHVWCAGDSAFSRN